MYKAGLFLSGTAILILAVSISSFRPTLPAWGFYGHRKINRQAVFTLPPELIVFYKKHIDYITEHAVDADKRRYATSHEAPRHFMDLDRYGEIPFDTLPRNWTDALMQFTSYYFIDEKQDTQLLITAPVLETDSFISLNPRLAAEPLPPVSRKDFRTFFIKNLLPQYYELHWLINTDSLATLLNTNKLNCQKIYAVDRFSEHGILPYHLENMLYRLTEAFMVKDVRKILRHSADIGHYIADAHVPLHTTQNYNGQLTGQDGIHAFWESRLPELFAEEQYDFWVGKAELIQRPKEYFWDIVLKSHSMVDSVLGIDEAIRKEFPADRQLCHEMRGNILVKTQCEEFAATYNDRLGGMVEARMQASIRAVGSAWYTAWVLAGQPDLRDLGDWAEGEIQDSTEMESPGQSLQNGEMKGRPHDQ